MAMLVALLLSLLVAAIAYGLLPVAVRTRTAQYERIAGLRPADEAQVPLWRALLEPFNRLSRYLPAALLARTRRQLYWAQRSGAWLGWDEVSFTGLRLAGATLGLLLMAPSSPAMAVAGVVLGGWLPGLLLAGRARRGERAFRRELPHLAHLLAMLVASGLSVAQALERIAAQPGLASGWFAEGLAQARGQRPLEVLLRRAQETGIAELANLIAQLGELERTGTGVEAVLEGLATDMSTAYRAEVLRRAKAIGSQLILPILVFYLLPYLVAIGAPMAASILGLFQ
ncbi:MAG TPA: type II secretion system F family protein [Anaerolineae bacterium]|nr:type II secretion system F family protein [Anaerolineae bacterium]